MSALGPQGLAALEEKPVAVGEHPLPGGKLTIAQLVRDGYKIPNRYHHLAPELSEGPSGFLLEPRK